MRGDNHNHDDIGVGGGENKHDYNGDDNYDDADRLLTLMFIIIDNIVLMVILSNGNTIRWKYNCIE